MEKIKGSVEVSKYVDENIYDIIKTKKEFKGCRYEDLLLLSSRVVERNALESKRDFSLNTSRTELNYIKNLKDNKIYSVYFKYKATHKSDGYSDITIQEWDKEYIESEKVCDIKKKILNIKSFDVDCCIDTYLLKTIKYDEYEIIHYSSYFYWIREEEERNILDEFVSLTLD